MRPARSVRVMLITVLLIVALEDTNEIVSVEGCFAADLGVNVFSTNISGLVSHIW